MFRRREDEELNVDAASQGSLLGNESVKVLAPETSSFAQPPHAAAPLSSTYPASSAPVRPVQEPAPRPQATSIPPVNFRTSQPTADVARSRMQESKPSSSFNTPPAASNERAQHSRRVLTVGADILLKGEIATCDRLVIEGKMDAVLNDVGTVELAESGSFKGVAQVENAEISGLFEGELVVKGRLVIYASGRVRGKITYGEIEIERGGELTGEIKTIASAGATRSGSSSARPAEKSSLKEKAEAA